MDWVSPIQFPSILIRSGWTPENIRAYFDPQYDLTRKDENLPFGSPFEMSPETVCETGDVVLVADDSFHLICRIRVSSHVLGSNSPVFERLFFGSFGEARERREKTEQPTEIHIRDNPRALLSLCRILHNNAHDWTEENLLDVSVLIDKYDVTERLRVSIYAALAWQRETHLQDDRLAEWTTVSYLLDQRHHFRQLTRKLVLSDRLYKIDTDLLDILPQELISSLRAQRMFLMLGLINGFSKIIDQYRLAAYSHSKHVHYFGLIENLKHLDLWPLDLQQFSLSELFEKLRRVELPILQIDGFAYGYAGEGIGLGQATPLPASPTFSDRWQVSWPKPHNPLIHVPIDPPTRADIVKLAECIEDHCMGVCLDCLRGHACIKQHDKPWLRWPRDALRKPSETHRGGEDDPPVEWDSLW